MGYIIRSVKGKLYLQADNIFNKTYSDLLGSRMPGRWLSGGIEIAL
jgi:iron complex outermembrane receptor protein